MSLDRVVSALIDDLSEYDTASGDFYIEKLYGLLKAYYRNQTRQGKKDLQQAIKDAKKYLEL